MELIILKNRLQMYLDAERKILHGQEYRLGDRMLRRADLATVRKIIDDLAAQIDELEGCTLSKRIKRVTFVD